MLRLPNSLWGLLFNLVALDLTIQIQKNHLKNYSSGDPFLKFASITVTKWLFIRLYSLFLTTQTLHIKSATHYKISICKVLIYIHFVFSLFLYVFFRQNTSKVLHDTSNGLSLIIIFRYLIEYIINPWLIINLPMFIYIENGYIICFFYY